MKNNEGEEYKIYKNGEDMLLMKVVVDFLKINELKQKLSEHGFFI